MELLVRLHVAEKFLKTLFLRCFLSEKQMLEAKQFETCLEFDSKV